MHISRTARVLVAFVLGLAAPGAFAQLTDDGGNIVIPQHRVVLPPIRETPVTIDSVSVDVGIREQVATTTVGIVLRNPDGRPQEAQLLMPVPEGATVRQFRLEGLPDEGIARVLTREEARRIYESIVRRTRDPGLVEFAGLNLIRSSVFPVPANGTQRMELIYEQVLPADGPRVDYVFPRSESLERSGVKWSFEARIKSAKSIGAVYSPSHDLTTERRDDGVVRVRVPEASASAPGAFRLSYVTAASDGLSASLLAYPDPKIGGGKGGYFMLLLGVPADDDRRKFKREVTVVIDRSGSMRGEKLEQARNAALQILDALDDGEMFNIIDYSDTIASFAAAPVVKDSKSAGAARAYLQDLKAVGGTNINDALVQALSPKPAEGMFPVVLFLTDGLPTVGVRDEREIREGARKANAFGRRIFAFGVGLDVNSPLLSGLANGARGVPTYVLPNEDIEVKVGQVFRRLQGPVLAEPVLSYALKDPSPLAVQPVREVLPGSLSDVFEGEQVSVFGQYVSGEPLRFTLRGRDSAGKEVTFEATFDLAQASVQHSYVPRIWATRKIGTLIDEIRQSGADGAEPNKELVDEVIRLSTEFGILTEYTAFLAAEQNEFFGGESGGRQPSAGLPMPELRARMEREAGTRLGGGRAGSGAVSQEANSQAQQRSDKLNLDNRLLYAVGGGAAKEAAVDETTFSSVRQSADQAYYRRGQRWVEAGLLDQAESEPERTIEFASDEYFTLVDRLAKENRQGVLAVEGDVYLMLDGKRTLVRQSS
ncbi:MAG: VWA domain-containing protein [Phycisphaerales bacterium]|nr:VWA domain-containing protein [Phycisphaerales bacterium]